MKQEDWEDCNYCMQPAWHTEEVFKHSSDLISSLLLNSFKNPSLNLHVSIWEAESGKQSVCKSFANHAWQEWEADFICPHDTVLHRPPFLKKKKEKSLKIWLRTHWHLAIFPASQEPSRPLPRKAACTGPRLSHVAALLLLTSTLASTWSCGRTCCSIFPTAHQDVGQTQVLPSSTDHPSRGLPC